MPSRLEGIAEAEEKSHRPLGRVALALQLPAEVGAQRPDRREIAEPEAGAGLEPGGAGGPEGPPVGPDVAGVEEQRASQRAEDREAVVEVGEHQTVAAHRLEVGARARLDQGAAADAQQVEAVGAVGAAAAAEEALVDEHVAAGQR